MPSGGLLEQVESPHHERVAGGVGASKHECLCLFVEAAGTRNLFVTMSVRIHQTVENCHVMRKQFELFRIVSQIINLVHKQLIQVDEACRQGA